VCETIVWIGIITTLQEIRAEIYVQIFMASFCVLSPFDDEVCTNILKSLPVDILQVKNLCDCYILEYALNIF